MKTLLGGVTKEIKTEKGIAEMKRLHINGTEQWVVIRGENQGNPILFHLHGGPGGSQTGNFRKYLSGLEKPPYMGASKILIKKHLYLKSG